MIISDFLDILCVAIPLVILLKLNQENVFLQNTINQQMENIAKENFVS